MKELYIYCAGGVGREIRAIAERSNIRHPRWSAIRFVDDVLGGPESGIPRYDDFLALHRPAESAEFLIGNGEPAHRKTLREKILVGGYELATLIDDTAVVAPDAVISPGAVLYPYVCISPQVVVEENVLLYYHCSVTHDSTIGTDSLLSMSVSVSGRCKIGSMCFLGANSIVSQDVTMGERCILGAGGVLLRDAPSGGVYGGVPARRLRENESERVFS